MSTKTNILIETRISESSSLVVERKVRRSKVPLCHGCGSPLTDPVSIQRGYGRKCFEKRAMIILHIPGEQS